MPIGAEPAAPSQTPPQVQFVPLQIAIQAQLPGAVGAWLTFQNSTVSM